MRTTVNLVDEALASAMKATLGKAKTDVINEALREYARRPARSCPRISPAAPAFLEKLLQGAGALTRLRAWPTKQAGRLGSLGAVQEALPLQPINPALRDRTLFGEDRGQASHRTASIKDQDGLAVADL